MKNFLLATVLFTSPALAINPHQVDVCKDIGVVRYSSVSPNEYTTVITDGGGFVINKTVHVSRSGNLACYNAYSEKLCLYTNDTGFRQCYPVD